MKKLNALVCCISLFAAGAGAACDYPRKPDVPNGSSASKDDMLAGQKEINTYIQALEAYQGCIVEEEKTARADMGELEADVVRQREEVVTKKYNAAHDEMLKAAAAFNAELEEFKSRDE
jgi:hypothetical protein